MKTHRFKLARYFQPESYIAGTIDIDWPSVHRQAGLDHIQWLKNQSPEECQMVIEHRPNDPYVYVVAEIYSDRLATEYALMWAK